MTAVGGSRGFGRLTCSHEAEGKVVGEDANEPTRQIAATRPYREPANGSAGGCVVRWPCRYAAAAREAARPTAGPFEGPAARRPMADQITADHQGRRNPRRWACTEITEQTRVQGAESMSTRAWIRQVSSLAKGGFLIGLKRFLVAYWFDAQISGKLQPFCRSGHPQDICRYLST